VTSAQSVGYWQASRIQALLGVADQARSYALTCLSYSHSLTPFYLGYAHEAIARAAFMSGESSKGQEYLELAKRHASTVESAENKNLLIKDLDALEQSV
jgi:hypothetical protein